jgi:hypothetical protein
VTAGPAAHRLSPAVTGIPAWQRKWFFSGCERGDARLNQFLIDLQNRRVLLYKTLVKETSRKAFEVVLLYRSEIALRDAEFLRDLCGLSTLTLALRP